jgi:hypothetical protein
MFGRHDIQQKKDSVERLNGIVKAMVLNCAEFHSTRCHSAECHSPDCHSRELKAMVLAS